jgi:hypothetical protein
MRAIRNQRLLPSHSDFPIVNRIEAFLLERAGGLPKLKRELPILIRQAIDEVIDTVRTGRVHTRELEKTEKTYIGTKVEILVRNYFRLLKGILDLKIDKIDGLDVDVKNTLGDNWMIPREAVGKPCILVASDELRRTCYFGIFVAHPSNLTLGVNQDKKRSVSSAGFANIHWILIDVAYPPSLWSRIGDERTHRIMRGLSGNERVEALFREVQGIPVHRDIVQSVAQQKDYMKRLRKNGGARDKLAREQIAILSGLYDRPIIAALKLGDVSPDEFISFRPTEPSEIRLLLQARKIE